MHMKLMAGLFCATLALSDVQAQTAENPADPDMQTVQVTGVRDPAMLPYKDAYELLTKLNNASTGKMEFVIRILSKENRQPIPNLELALRGDNTFERVQVAPDGRVTVPLDDKAYGDNAEFVSNQKKGSISVEFHFVPKLPAERISYADVVASIEAGRRARNVLVPWYLRLFVGQVKTVGLCYPDSGRQIQLSGATADLRPANIDHAEDGGMVKLHCARFGLNEKDLGSDTLISAPPGWRAVFM